MDSVIRTLARPLRRVVATPYRKFVQAPTPGDFRSDLDAVSSSGPFSELFLAHEGREATKWAHYMDIYDTLFDRFRAGFVDEHGTRPLRFLEIGVKEGGSLELWRKYFAPETVIFGVDIDPRCLAASTDEHPVRIGSQADPAFLRDVVEEMGGVDIVLDDGSHIARHQRASFDVLFPMLTPGGMYVVEDTVTSYWFTFGGGFRRPGTIVEVAKSMTDGMAKSWFRAPVGRRGRLAHRSVKAIHFFESIIAFEKGDRQPPAMVFAGSERIPKSSPDPSVGASAP